MERAASLRELAIVFLRLGLTSFGGPAAHIALMREELVRRRGWLTDQAFLDLVGAANLIPGPTSTELAIHLGHRRAGWAGLVVAGLSFLLPAVAIVLALAWAYVAYGSLPQARSLLAGIQPVVVAIVVAAGVSLARTAFRTPALVALALAAVAATLAGVSEIGVLLGGGALALGWWRVRTESGGPATPGAVPVGPAIVAAASGTASIGLLPIFLTFVKIGAVLFGSGYVLVALLRSELVVNLGWIDERQLLDAVAAGQITPGALFTTATFIGYLLAGVPGAAVGTVAVFLPAFVGVAASIPILPRLERSRAARAFLDGVNAVAIALLAVVAWRLAGSAIHGPATLALGVVALAALVSGRVGTLPLVVAGGAIGLLLGLE